ncbi:hypothetical protein WMF31_07915 [Sorangium sp. So ce1036]|uniref:hypothetical protein n=1 Tax=Sorangium sp. So ce1036 TaxID=3133328 RepID=UPI003F035251
MRSVPGAAPLLLLAALAACDQAAPASETPREQTAALSPATALPPVISTVAWPAAASLDRGALAALPRKAAHMAMKSQVPVLVPPRRELLAAPVIVTRQHWTSFWARTEELTVSLMMTRLSRKHPSIPPLRGAHSVRGKPALVTVNEGIWSAAWAENGVSYALDVECASPEAPPCASDALVRELAAELVYVGGAGASAAGGPR